MNGLRLKWDPDPVNGRHLRFNVALRHALRRHTDGCSARGKAREVALSLNNQTDRKTEDVERGHKTRNPTLGNVDSG